MTNAHEPSEQLRAAAHRLTHPMQLCSHGDDSDACQLAHAPAADNQPANLSEAAAMTTPAYAAVVAERYPSDGDDRVAFLNPLRRFFAEHPDTPDISYAQVHTCAASRDEFLRLAEKHGATPYGPKRDQFSVMLDGDTLLVVVAPREDRPL